MAIGDLIMVPKQVVTGFQSDMSHTAAATGAAFGEGMTDAASEEGVTGAASSPGVTGAASSPGVTGAVPFLVSQDCIKPLCDLLICLDPRIVMVCLEGLENILKEKAVKILERYWAEKEEDEQNVQNGEDKMLQGFNFGVNQQPSVPPGGFKYG
ncbi:hypothetical protein GOBAR_DD07519 [Gossypium barbadense]|nr:hypothetical protein GOBAR_DD07519 [Gossypium barbadense]